MPTILDMLIKTASEDADKIKNAAPVAQEEVAEEPKAQEEAQEEGQEEVAEEPKAQEETAEVPKAEDVNADSDIQEFIDSITDEEAGEILAQMTEDEELVKSAFYYGMISVADASEEDFVKTAMEIKEQEDVDIVLDTFNENIEKIASEREAIAQILLEKIAADGLDTSNFTDEENEFLEGASEEQLEEIIENMVTKEATVKAAFSVGMNAMNTANELDHEALMKSAADETESSELDVINSAFEQYIDKIASLTVHNTEYELDKIANEGKSVEEFKNHKKKEENKRTAYEHLLENVKSKKK